MKFDISFIDEHTSHLLIRRRYPFVPNVGDTIRLDSDLEDCNNRFYTVIHRLWLFDLDITGHKVDIELRLDDEI